MLYASAADEYTYILFLLLVMQRLAHLPPNKKTPAFLGKFSIRSLQWFQSKVKDIDVRGIDDCKFTRGVNMRGHAHREQKL